MATPRDVQEIVTRLSSSKAKAREEGVKLLGSWLEGERSFSFCRLLGQSTSRLRPDEIPHAETWPFLITLLTKCIASEKVASKKSQPKLVWAKTLRTAIQHAEDPKISGKTLLLLSVVKHLFNHIWEFIKDVPNFQSEYGIILRHLLSVKEYRYHMRTRIYCSLALQYMKRIQTSLSGKNEIHSNAREEVFRCILTLHNLLENPPGDFPDNIREDIVKSFIEIFSLVREEGKISRKLMECVNTYLLKDGPNLGSKAMEIHSCLHDFIFRYWLTTHDQGLKNTFILYAKMQLKLTRRTEGGPLIEELLDVIGKELDQGCAVGSVGMSWSEATRDDKVGPSISSQQSLMELAASVLYQACVNTLKASGTGKRLKRQDALDRLRDGLMKGKWLWCGAFCFLIHNYGFRIEESSITYWFKGISESFERILNDSYSIHSYDGVLWILRGLQELCFVLSHSVSKKYSSPTSDEVRGGWNVIWSCLMHGLPIFSNMPPVADAALILLGYIVSEDLISMPIVPREVWELQIFKHMPSLCALYFIACYFSRGVGQGNHHDVLYLRKNLLRAAFQLINSKESLVLNKDIATILPAAIFSLCVGYCPFRPSSICPVPMEGWSKVQENDETGQMFSEYSVEILADIDCRSDVEASEQETHHGIRLPQEIREQLIHEMEQYLTAIMNFDREVEKKVVSNLFSCLFLSNSVYSLSLTRLRNEKAQLFSKMLECITKLLEVIVSIIEERNNELQLCDSLSLTSVSDFSGSALASLCCFMRCPLFCPLGDVSALDGDPKKHIVLSIEKLLLALAKLFENISCCITDSNMGSGSAALLPSSSNASQHLHLSPDRGTRIVDMELDIDEGSNDLDSMTISGDSIPFSSLQWKMDMISTISVFFTVLPVTTWEVMLDLLEKESDPKVAECLLVSLCKYFPLSDGTFVPLVILMNNMMNSHASHKVSCASILSAIRSLLGSLVSSRNNKRSDHLKQQCRQTIPEQNLASLGALVNKIADEGLPDWTARVVLIECIYFFILLDPSIGQDMIAGLLVLLKDPDYRVRLFLARKVGILFQTWDGHDELLQDICSNFGLHLVMATKDKLVKAREVLAAGSQSHLTMETALVTLAHLAFHSDKLELEVVFMICAVAAISPDQRDLIYALLDNISRHLLYSSRIKYFEELFGPVLSRWITCELSLVALVEVRDLFVEKAEAKVFMQFCCQWLIPLLMIRQDMGNLNLVSTVAGQPLSVLTRKHVVKICAICMALCCSSSTDKEVGEFVLSTSILQIAEISEDERDDLIKKYMVSIVSCLLLLSFASPDPPMPFFSMETVVSAIQTVVDGFLEIDNCPTTARIIDKLNIFRPDRVFKFLLEIHYQITTAVHPRHKCHRLSAVEVLIKIIGHRATVSSTSLYIFNIVGQFIMDPTLQDQCCAIVSTLLLSFRGYNPSRDGVNVLGEQLQFLVSKLVACCTLDDGSGASASGPSSKIVSLVQQLTVDADSSLYTYIRELEPFPDIACFQRIQEFHNELCRACSTRDHFLNLVKKINHVPQKLVLWSLRTLHTSLLLGKIIQPEMNVVDASGGFNCWTSDPEVVCAVWTLVGVCASSKAKEMSSLVADFISRVGIGDPHRIVFHLPGKAIQHESFPKYVHNNADEATIHNGFGVSEEVLINLVRLLLKYLLDDGVMVVDMTARTLRGILSTELGQHALLTFNAYERSLISVHSKGVNSQVVEKLIFDCEGKSMSGDLSTMALWKTHSKSYEMWICPLVQSLIHFSHDNILKLCQDIVLLKVEVAELLLPSVLVNLSGRRETENDLCRLISKKVEENIFLEANYLIKSILVWLDALNIVRCHHVAEKALTSPVPSKHSRSSSLSRTRTPEKYKDSLTSPSLDVLSSSTWKKVYWLSIDYLVVAKAAIHCGSYFTAVMYVEYWCEENFHSLTLGRPDFSNYEALPPHIELLVSAVTRINEPDSIYGIIQTCKVSSQIITHEHEGNWNKALEYYDLLIRKDAIGQAGGFSSGSYTGFSQGISNASSSMEVKEPGVWKLHKGLMRSLQQIGCSHVLNVYLEGLADQRGHFQHDQDFAELQYEAAWRAGNWDFSLFPVEDTSCLGHHMKNGHFNQNLHSCLRALQEGDCDAFHGRLTNAKEELVISISNASKESTEYINSAIVKLQMLDHLSMAWNLRWKPFLQQCKKQNAGFNMSFTEPVTPTISQLECMNGDWRLIVKQTQLHLNLLEPFIAFRHILLQILRCKESTAAHLLESASVLRKGSKLSLAAAAMHEFKLLCGEAEKQAISYLWSLGRLEEAKILRAQGQHEMAINLTRYILENYELAEEASNVYRLIGKWLAETRSSSSRTILEQYLKYSVELAELNKNLDNKSVSRQCKTYFHLAHYTDALFKSYEERLTSSEWQAALQLRKHKTRELDALIRRLKSSAKAEKTDYSAKIQELQKQLTMDREEAEKLQDDRDNFLGVALEGYQHCLILGGKYDMRVVFRLVSLWFCFPSRQNVLRSMLNAVKEVQSHKFIPLVYQIASRMGNPKDGQGSLNFQAVLVSLVKKMAIDHPYHTIFQLLALANGDRVKDKQRSRNSFIVDMDKKLAAENLLNELTSYHGAIIRQMKQMVDIYIKLAELETKKEETNRRIPLPREIRSVRHLELVPVVTATFPVDPSCQYGEGSFPHFKGLGDSITVMNGINAPKVVECLGSDGHKYRQLAKSGNDDLRQDAVMEQFFGLVNTFLQGNRDTWKRRLRIRTYKVVPFTPSAGVLEWVDQTVPLGEYLIGSLRNGGAHGRYGIGDWSFIQCREHMTNEKDKRKAFQKVSENFRPVMHYFFLERFLQPADWFEKRLSYTRSVATSSMVGYIVGLGDRHSMNILIDQASAEVVHIDLGVAFEQGLMLKTPERVPFRLTRDIVDGMGVTGVEGVFRRCSEATLAVMRTNKEALLTIIEVFIHDPLYKWALSPLKALQRQKERDEDAELSMEDSHDACEGNKDAARALFRVKQKLDGYEDGEMRSVQGQVQQLIQDAIDTERLCLMFPGWGPWL